MFHSKPFKKDITPFAKGGQVVKHIGKGSREQSSRGGESLTGGNPYERMSNSYPKSSASAPSSESEPPPSPVPMGSKPAGAPTAMMPPSGGGDEGGGGGVGGEEE